MKLFKLYSALLVIILRTAQKESLCVLVCRFCISRKGGKGLTGGGRWGHPQGDMHVVAAGVGCKSAKVPWLGPVGPILALTVRIQDFSSKFSGLHDRLLNFTKNEIL